jgi:hypothetical protein
MEQAGRCPSAIFHFFLNVFDKGYNPETENFGSQDTNSCINPELLN